MLSCYFHKECKFKYRYFYFSIGQLNPFASNTFNYLGEPKPQWLISNNICLWRLCPYDNSYNINMNSFVILLSSVKLFTICSYMLQSFWQMPSFDSGTCYLNRQIMTWDSIKYHFAICQSNYYSSALNWSFNKKIIVKMVRFIKL